MINIDTDWKKFAAQTHSDKDVEKAFLDQAYTFIQNKATPFMKDPYKLGFEIVFKNDSNTRMVGIFAFRVNDELLYAPVFFINGSIKGTDLLYRHQTKKFVPLTNDWCQYLISLSPYEEGQGISDKNKSARSSHEGLNLRKLIFPPSHSGSNKHASYDEIADLNLLPKSADVYEDLCSKAIEQLGDKEDVVKNFILEDGGYSSVELLKEACLKDENFATAMIYQVGADKFLPSELNKEAAEQPQPVDKGIHIVQKGFSDYDIVDNREETTSQVFLSKESTHDATNGVHNSGSILSSTITNEGKEQKAEVHGRYMRDCYGAHELLKNAGTSSEFFVMPVNDEGNAVVVDMENFNWQKVNVDDLVITKEADESFSEAQPAKTVSPNEELLTSGNMYMEFKSDENGIAMSEPFRVLENQDSYSDGVEKYKVKDASSKQSRWLTVKADDEVTFVPCGKEVDLGLASKRQFEKIAREGGLKQASIERRGDYRLIKEERGTTSELNKLGSSLYMMTELGFSQPLAEELFEKSSSSSRVKFYYTPTIEKSAMNLAFDNPPEFYANFDSDFDVPSESPQSSTVLSRSSEPDRPQGRVGDSVKFDSIQSLETQTPESLAQLSEEVGNQSIFEHGVVGSLAKTYDSTKLVDKYMPDLEEGLDKIGRLIFLFYWKPEDFTQLYGSDDQADLENMLLSNFKSFGDLVLALLKKTKFNAPGIAVTTQ